MRSIPRVARTPVNTATPAKIKNHWEVKQRTERIPSTRQTTALALTAR